MIVHRFVFLTSIQLPGRAPLTMWEPGSIANAGYEATRTADGWLFLGSPGALSGLSGGGAEELADLGMDREGLRLGVLVPHAQIVVHYAVQAFGEDPSKLPTTTPSLEAGIARRARRAKAEAQAAEHARTAPPEPPPAPPPAVVAPPAASKRRGPLPAPAPPPPSVGWVDE